MRRIWLVSLFIAATAGCAAVPAATSDLPSGPVTFRVEAAVDAPARAVDSARRCLDRPWISDALIRGSVVSASTEDVATRGQNRRVHICLQAVPGVDVEAAPS